MPLSATVAPGLAADPGIVSDAGQIPAPGAGLDAGYEQLRHAALHARAEAFPLGFAVLTRKGITAWRRALTDLTSERPTAPATTVATNWSLSTQIATELIDALAAVALAGI